MIPSRPLIADNFLQWFRHFSLSFLTLLILFFLHFSCARLFGWNIHAPGLLSENFVQEVQPLPTRMALYLDPALPQYRSANKGSWSADPQTYYIGESLSPMLLEGFQEGFEEFIFLEVEPTAQILKHYGIPYLAVVRIKDFQNRVTWKGQALSLVTETAVFDSDLRPLATFKATGTSDAKRVFAKKGGPETNLNAALENNVQGIIQFLQDSIRTGNWQKGIAPT